ncbi:Structural maintenance of chromosomes protein [Zostera marina]|uniref:Structural maintenance of chromosomes protein n=1 Tax=Zostera marina TaxID=29655 RepID=A0A0K9PT12_ZOSMR|nr:Structural maintenance of chromosomes protein [Zostera marina]
MIVETELNPDKGDNGATEPPSRRPRLFIKEMIMRNFKSYAGEQRVGPFHKSFTAVVGPNGSGKSNVIDSMLFVFGKRAKQMRLNKVSELIHNSSNHQNLEKAEVSVHFQEIIDLDDGTYEVIKGSDFMITRTAFRDNSSKYYINDKGSSFTEVTKKLKGKGIDLDNNRFLILQGEVEQISLMKPKSQGPHDEGFLEYLEDIIGTNQYIEKIEEINGQLESIIEKRSGVVQLVKLAEKEKDSLEDAKNEAEAYMLKELSLLRWKEKAIKFASDDAISHAVEIKNNASNLEESLKNERQIILDKSTTLNDLEVKHNELMKTHEELSNDLMKSKNQFKEFERQDVKYREDLKHSKQKIKKLEDKLVKDSSKIDEIVRESEKSTNLIPKLEVEIPKLQQILMDEESVLEKIRESSKEETEKYRLKLAEVHSELEPWEKQRILHKRKYDVSFNECNILKEKHDACRKAFENSKAQMDDISNKIKTKNVIISDTNNDLLKHKTEASQAREMEQECIKQQDLLIPMEQAARQKVAELLSVMESEKSQGSVLKAILQAKESKEIDGIYGRLGDLGAIDAKYDISISTACPGLDYIVVETAAAAQACVELLRKKNLGVGTFMILEKQMNHLQKMRMKVNTPENVPRLFDLITVENERLKLAFYATLQNTIVAKDLDQATRISYGKNNEFRRVVTLEGALFEKSGTMSGGGGKPKGGKMGTSIKATVSADAVAIAEKDLAELVDQLNGLREKVSHCIKVYQSLDRVIMQLEMTLLKSQKEIDNLNEQYCYIEKQLSSLRDAAEPRIDELDRLKELNKCLSEEEEELEKIFRCSVKLKEKSAELQKMIEMAGGEQLKKQILKVTNIQEDIEKTSTEINRHKVLISTNQKTEKKLTKAIEESKKEKEKTVIAKEKMCDVFKEIEQKAFLVQENYSKTQALIDQHKEVLTEAKENYSKVKKTMDDLRAAEVDSEYKLQDMKKLCKEWEMKRKELVKRLDDIKVELSNHMQQVQKDAIDPEKIQEALSAGSINNDCDLKRASEMVALFEAQMKEMRPNLDSISEYRKKTSLYNERVEELNSATQERDNLKNQYDDLKKRRLDEFMSGFNIISLKLKEMYQMITLGGDSELELVDSLDPFSEGVVFSVRPPKKSWKNISNLSGGEKTLSSLALVFALHHYKPTPLYVMDEIDAALDFKNVSIVGHYVKDRTKDAQFIIISLRNNMFELADRLVGIYKTNNCTKSITIDPGCFVTVNE